MAALFKNPIPRNSSEDPEEFRATLVEHLEELRTRIIRVVWMLTIAWVLAWYFVQPWFYTLLNDMIHINVVPMLKAKNIPYQEMFTSATAGFMLKMKLSFMIGFIAVFPFALLQVWGFVAPALKPNEKRPFRIIAPLSLVLFFTGAGFAWWLLPNALRWFTSYVEDFPGTALFQEAGIMVFFVLKMLLAFGLAFQLPLIVYAIGAIGLLSSATMLKYWRQGAVTVFALSAIITPSNDAFTMLMMALPMCILFIVSVYAVKFTQRKKERARAEAE